ncbi:MAG: hypothetical protein RLZZ450_6843 [Pseudomonadota bacterium]|jgi:hypothetical protein
MISSRANVDASNVLFTPSSGSAEPSSGLLRAALAGLLAVGVAACEEEQKEPDWACLPTPGSDGGSTSLPTASSGAPVNDAGALPVLVDAGSPTPVVAPAPIVDAGTTAPVVDAASAADAGPVGPITTKETEGDVTLATLKAQCVALGGYPQIHAACAGANNCKGFSYGDWSPGVTSEHSCASANGCTGLSCVVLPKDTGKTGKEVYESDKYAAGGPSSCLNCHAVWNGKDAAGNHLPPDTTKFKVWQLPGGTRTEQNWLELSAEAQEAVVAFGRTGVMADGTAQVSMRGYHQLISRAEVQRVVQYLRTLTPVLAEIKAPK